MGKCNKFCEGCDCGEPCNKQSGHTICERCQQCKTKCTSCENCEKCDKFCEKCENEKCGMQCKNQPDHMCESCKECKQLCICSKCKKCAKSCGCKETVTQIDSVRRRRIAADNMTL